MSFRTRAQLMLLSLAVAAAASVTATPQRAVTTGAHDAPLTQTVPVDPRITVGTLPNGLRYYVRANKNPQGRAELRLVVNAGSVLEEDDQRGLAHFVEHMCFNGTSHFPKQEVIAFLQSTGVRFGAHINANTSFDQTVYQLQIPTDNGGVIDRSMLILEDWAHAVSFDPEEIDKERGVILEEWRVGLGADARILDAQLPVLLKDSRYAERLPIGKPDIIQSFKYDRLKKFYTDWYRPDLMAVVAVGDFDPARMESLIRSHFGPIPAPASPRPRPIYEMPDHPGTRYAIATDSEATATIVGVSSMMAARDQTTIGAYRQQTIERVFSGLLSARLAEMGQKPDAPFLDAETNRGLFVHSTEATTLTALVPEGGVERGLAALFTEADRVARFGFTQTELDRYRLSLMKTFEQLAASNDEHTSVSLAEEFIRNFMQQEPIPGIAYENGLVQRFLPEITLADVNSLATSWVPDRNRVVVVSAPKKAGSAVPDEAKLASVIKGAGGGALTAYVDTVSARPLLDTTPKPGSVAKTVVKEAAGVTEWTLSNGVRVVLDPTTFKQDEILVRAFSPGGTSLARDQDFVAAETATQVVAQGGLGTLTTIDLSKKLAGKAAFVRADIGDMYEGLSGRALRRDLETMFQLIYLTFTQPRADAEAFRVMTGQLSAGLANRQAQPDAAFDDALTAALTQNHMRAQPMSPALVAQMNLDKSMAFYKDRFADASDFTFVLVGSFDLPTIKPLVERYLGSLPALHRKEAGRDVGIRPPQGVVEKQVTKGTAPKSEVGVVFTGAFQNNQSNRLIIRALSNTLAGNLQRVLREDLGGTYGVSVSPDFTKRPTEEYRLTINFACDPARTQDLIKALFAVVDEFRTNGPSPGQVADVQAALRRDLETDSRQNGYVLNQLAYAYQYDEPIPDAATLRGLYGQLTTSMLRDAARTYLDTNHYVKVVLMPEGK
jgi:zinc protease